MPDLTRKQQSKKPRKIALKKATGSQILSGLNITKAEMLHVERALASAKRMLGGDSVQPKPTKRAAALRLQKAGSRRGLKAVK
jgi:hypothetical protein